MIIYTNCTRCFCFFTTEQVSCHQRFIGLIMNGAGSQVLGVGDSEKECFVRGNTYRFQLPIFKQCSFVKEMILENTFHSVGTSQDYFHLPDFYNIAFV